MSKLNLKIISTSSDGTVKIMIDKVRYSYAIGGHQVQRFLDLAKRKQGKALGYLKKCAGDNFIKEE